MDIPIPNDPILLVVPDDWRDQLREILESQHYIVLLAQTNDEAAAIIQSGGVSALVISSDHVAFEAQPGVDLVQMTSGKIPTLTIIKNDAFQLYGQVKVFGKVFTHQVLREYCSVPFDAEEFLGRLQMLLRRKKFD